jgi:elongator complex protein 1
VFVSPRRVADIAVKERLLVTPFRTQNVPPPMSSYIIDLPSTPVHISASHTEDAIAAVFRDGSVSVWDLNTKIPDPRGGSKLRGGGKIAEPKIMWEKCVNVSFEGGLVKQVAFGKKGEVGILTWRSGSGSGQWALSIISGGETEEYGLEGVVERVIYSDSEGWLALDDTGLLFSGTCSNS